MAIGIAVVVLGDRARCSSLAACGSGRGRRRQQQRQRQLDRRPAGARAAASTSTPATARPTRAPSRVSGDTIKIGTSLPQSGLYAAFAAILQRRAGVLRLHQRTRVASTVAGKKYKIELVAKDDAYDAREDGHQRPVADQRRQGVRAVQRRRHEEQPRDPRHRQRRSASRTCSPRRGAAQWGNHDYPWMIGSELVPYPLEMQAFVDYLKENKPNATIAVLRRQRRLRPVVRRDAARSWSRAPTSRSWRTQSYDTEGADVQTQVTSLAATKADVFVLGADAARVPDRAQRGAATRAGSRSPTCRARACRRR